MRTSLTIGGALLALAAFVSTADARMGGGGGMSMSPSMSHGAPISSMSSSSMGSPRGFSPDGRTFGAGGLATRVKGSNWKHPIDSDGGGPSDPPNKPPKGSTQTGSNGADQVDPHDPYGFHGHHNGWYDRYHHYHPGSGDGSKSGNNSGGNSSGNRTEPAPAFRTPR